jgi:hypothetical protein
MLEVYQEVLPTTELTMRREELNKRLKGREPRRFVLGA